jgi:hypothetical protein
MVAPATWRARSSGERGKTERRPRGSLGHAHLGRDTSGGWPVAARMATGGGPMAVAAFWRLFHDGKVPTN